MKKIKRKLVVKLNSDLLLNTLIRQQFRSEEFLQEILRRETVGEGSEKFMIRLRVNIYDSDYIAASVGPGIK